MAKVFDFRKFISRIIKDFEMLEIVIFLLLLALLPLPYGYYIILKFFVCFTAIRQLCITQKSTIDTNLILIAIALLYNPIIKIPLGRTIWIIVNVLTSIYFVYYLKNKRSI